MGGRGNSVAQTVNWYGAFEFVTQLFRLKPINKCLVYVPRRQGGGKGEAAADAWIYKPNLCQALNGETVIPGSRLQDIGFR